MGRPMNDETRYSYQKRIDELRRENSQLYDYRQIVRNIFDGCVEVIGNGNTSIKIGWVMSQIRPVIK